MYSTTAAWHIRGYNLCYSLVCVQPHFLLHFFELPSSPEGLCPLELFHAAMKCQCRGYGVLRAHKVCALAPAERFEHKRNTPVRHALLRQAECAFDLRFEKAAPGAAVSPACMIFKYKNKTNYWAIFLVAGGGIKKRLSLLVRQMDAPCGFLQHAPVYGNLVFKVLARLSHRAQRLKIWRSRMSEYYLKDGLHDFFAYKKTKLQMYLQR